jgi:hypothetical protein
MAWLRWINNYGALVWKGNRNEIHRSGGLYRRRRISGSMESITTGRWDSAIQRNGASVGTDPAKGDDLQQGIGPVVESFGALFSMMTNVYTNSFKPE